MKETELQRKLIAAARAHRPGDQVPYAFEKRIMARLGSRTVADTWALWSNALWRAAGPCIAISLLLSAWSWLAPGGTQNSDLSQDFENTVLAAVDQETAAEPVR